MCHVGIGLLGLLTLFGTGSSDAETSFKNTPLYRHIVRGRNGEPARLYAKKPVDSGKDAEVGAEASTKEQKPKSDGKPAGQAKVGDRYRAVSAPGRAPDGLTDPSTFTPEMPLREAVDILRNSTRPRLNIVVLWKDLEENADIYPDTPIGIDGISGVSLSRHLKSLVDGVSGGAPEKLGYVVDDGVILIATLGSLPERMVTRVYDITDLVGQPSTGGFQGFGFGMPGMGMQGGFGMGMPFGGGYGMQGGMMPGGMMGGLMGGLLPGLGGGYGNFGGGLGVNPGLAGTSYGTFR